MSTKAGFIRITNADEMMIDGIELEGLEVSKCFQEDPIGNGYSGAVDMSGAYAAPNYDMSVVESLTSPTIDLSNIPYNPPRTFKFSDSITCGNK